MSINEEKEQVAPVLELAKYVKDFCEKNKMSCFVSVVKKDAFKTSIGCITGGNLKDVSSALKETMKRDETVTEVINEAFVRNLVDKMETNVDSLLEEVLRFHRN